MTFYLMTYTAPTVYDSNGTNEHAKQQRLGGIRKQEGENEQFFNKNDWNVFGPLHNNAKMIWCNIINILLVSFEYQISTRLCPKMFDIKIVLKLSHLKS